MPRTLAQLSSGSPNARYVAQLNLAVRDAIASHIKGLVSDGTSLRSIAGQTRVSINCLRWIVSGKTQDITVGTAVALAHGLGLGTVEALLGPVGTHILADDAATQHPRD